MSRLDDLAQNSAAADVDLIEQTLTELKTSVQFISGSNVLYFHSQRPGTYDWQDRIPDPGGLGFGGKLFLVEVTAQTMDFIWANIRVDLFKGSPPVAYRPDSVFADIIAGNDYFIGYVYDAPNDTSDPRVKRWYYNVTGAAGPSAPLLSIKFTAEALDQVNIAITELN